MRCGDFATILLLVVCSAAFNSARGAFTNTSFETGDFGGWTVGGTATHGVALTGTPITSDIVGNQVKAYTGSYAAWAILGGSPQTTFSLEQTSAVTPGMSYQWGMNETCFSDPLINANGVQFGISYYFNGQLHSGGSMSGLGYLGIISGYTAPAGTTSVTIDWIWTASAPGGGVAGVSIDDVFFKPVPEPGSAAMLTAAAAAILSRRRKR